MLDPQEVVNWLKKAEHDFEGAVTLSRKRKHPLSDLVCFHCQQAAEKYLKAFLIFSETPFPKTHDLLLLLELAIKHQKELQLHRDLFEYLNPYSVHYRYPSEETTPDEATKAVIVIKKIRRIFHHILPASLFEIIQQNK